jgi:hypothetical protein
MGRRCFSLYPVLKVDRGLDHMGLRILDMLQSSAVSETAAVSLVAG